MEPTFMWGVVSPTDPQPAYLKYDNKESADRHAAIMTSLIECWESTPGFWNKDYWQSKPEPWIVVPLGLVLPNAVIKYQKDSSVV